MTAAAAAREVITRRATLVRGALKHVAGTTSDAITMTAMLQAMNASDDDLARLGRLLR